MDLVLVVSYAIRTYAGSGAGILYVDGPKKRGSFLAIRGNMAFLL